MSIKESFLFLILCLLLCNAEICYGQEIKADTSSQSQQLYKHVIDVYFINGYALGYLLNYDSNSGIRMVLDLSSTYSNNEQDLGQEFPTKLKDGYHRFNFSIQYLTSIYRNDFGDIYLGAGPFFGYEWNNNSTTTQRYDYIAETAKKYTLETESSNYNGTITTGITALLGFKGKVSQSIFVFAEAQLTGGRSWNESENETVLTPDYRKQSNKSTIKKNGWYYNFSSVRLGVRFAL